MLEVVKVHRTRVILEGANTAAIIKCLRACFPVEVLYKTPVSTDEDLVDIEETTWWNNNKHRALAGARLKAGLTQKQLAAKTDIRQSVLSEYENGKRKVTPNVAEKLAEALDTYPEKFVTQ